MRRLLMIVTGSLMVILAACTQYEIPAPDCPGDLPTNVSFATQVQPIFDANCLMCHGGSQDPNLSPGWSYDELKDGGYVDMDAGNPCSSQLYQALITISEHDGKYNEDEAKTILGWINEGAEDN